jgi:hypothetical protein
LEGIIIDSFLFFRTRVESVILTILPFAIFLPY